MSQLDELVDRLIGVIDDLPESKLRPAAWGPREMLVHIVFAHEMYVRNLSAVAKGEPPPLWVGRYLDQNAQALESNRDATVPQLIDRLRAAHQLLKDLAVEPRVVGTPFYFKAGSKPRTLAGAIGEVCGHFRGHIADIRRLSRRAP
jgi:hypothetical protein